MNTAPEPPVRPVIPDHQLIRLIGEGSYGEIWMAKNVIGTYRAVKIVYRANFQDARPYDREFKGIRKFEPISRSHPGLVQVLQVGRNDEAGYFYYVMELADDEAGGREFHPDTYSAKSLSKVLDRLERLSAVESLQIGVGLAAALAHMHRQELVHRDVKPSNIIFVQGQPKLADIGLVVPLTDARTFVGTEGYIPPEGPGTIQADIYSLGKVLYEMSTGQDRQAFPELPNELDTFEDRSLVLELNEIVVKACANSPHARYDDAEELRRDAEILLAGRSVKRLHFVERQLARVRRLAIASILVAMGVAFFAYWLNRVHRRERQLLADAYVSTGTALVADAKLHASLPYFAAALQIEQTGLAADTHRLRIGAALQQAPRLLQWYEHHASVVDVRFSADGEQLLVAAGRVARVVNIASGKTVCERAASTTVESAAFSPDQKRIAIGSGHNVTIVDLASGTNVFKVSTHQDVYDVEFSPDGQELVVARGDCACLMDANRGVVLEELRGQTRPVSAASFSPDGAFIVTASYDGTARVWDGKSHQLIVVLRHPPWLYDATFSPDGRRVATASADHTIRIFEVPSGRTVVPRMDHMGAIRRVRFSADGRMLVSAALDQTVRFWNAKTGKAALSIIDLQAPAMSAAFGPAARLVATADNNGKVQVWDVWPAAPYAAGNGVVCANGDRYVTFTSNSFRVWNGLDNAPLMPATNVPHPIASVQCSADGKTVVLLSAPDPSRHVTAYVKNGELPLGSFSLPGPLGTNWLSPDGTILLTTSNRTVALWNTAGGALLFPPREFPHHIAHATFSPDNLLVAMAEREMLFVLETRTGALRCGPLKHKREISSIDFTGDGSRIVSATKDPAFNPGPAYVWDSKNGQSLVVTSPHSDGISDVRFSHDGRFFVTGAEDACVSINDAATGRLQKELIRMPWRVESVNFASNGRWLLATTPFETQVWDADQGRAVTPAFSAPGVFTAGGFCGRDRRIWIQSRNGLLFWDLPSTSRGSDEVIALADEFGAAIPPDLRWNHDALPVEKLREQCAQALAGTRNTTESWHRSQADLCEQAEEWFAAQFHLEQLLKRAPHDPTVLARLDVVKSHLSAAESSAAAP